MLTSLRKFFFISLTGTFLSFNLFSDIDTKDQIKELTSIAESIIELKKERQDAKEWHLIPIPFRKTKDDYDEAIEEVVSSIEKTLFEYDYLELVSKINKSKDQIKEVEKQIADLREDKYFAKNADVAKWYESNKDDYSEKISKKELEIKQFLDEISNLESLLAKRINNLGVYLTKDQIKVYTSSADVNEFAIQLSTFNYIRDLNQEIGSLLKENPAAAVRYYGTYLTMTEFLAYILNSSIKTYDEVYLPKINTLIKTTKETIKTSKQLSRKTSVGEGWSTLQKNIETNNFNLIVLNNYESYLKKKRATLVSKYKANEITYGVVYSSYATAKTSQEILYLINQAENQISSLSRLILPEIIPFENNLIEEKWIEISTQISEFNE
ncbi:hypothetical protein N9C67_01675 [Gammaproteobacteria bacterium]|nr:hypothetical protein [Gammaproteobacteria bacterium]